MNRLFNLAIRVAGFQTTREGRLGSPSRLNVRRGVAVLLVLGMLAMTLALSYASLRGQATVAQLAENLGRGESARMAAESGIYDALRAMSESNWPGVGTAMTGDVTDSSWYEVSFTTGDAQLTPADPSYGEFAYRVTITSTGYANDPSQPTVRAIHKIDAVVQLARRTILPEPAGWTALTDYTVHQWGNRDITVQEPVRVNGQASILGRMLLSEEYPLTIQSRREYLSGLNGMRLDGRGDHRPFKSPLTIALLRQDGTTLDLLTTRLGLVTVDTLAPTTQPAAHPNMVVNYKLYPGGKSYTPPILQTLYTSTLQNLTVAPDPVTNPLGIYRSRNALTISNNVNIKGTIVSEGTPPDIQVTGTNVTLEAVNLAPIEGSNEVYQLPVAIIKENLRLHSASAATVRGLALVYNEFEIKQGSPATSFLLRGNLFTSGLALRGRDTWVMTQQAWADDLDDFEDANEGGLLNILLSALLDTIRNVLGLGPGAQVYFPEWMQHRRGFTVQPALQLEPETSGVKPHWHNWAQPVYQKDPADPGLRWNLIRWSEAS
jgi:hypothetical protein